MGRRTRASAGASIAHVHKQIWGMAPNSVNLADHLKAICLAYERQQPSKDYLGSYYLALKKAGLVIWENKDVALLVPFGQIALHELQILIKRTGTRTFLDLNPSEIQSLSLAEYIVTRLYGRLDINSFNEILLSLPFDDEESKTFRLIFTFITREVDLAISELSLLYVVDQHPSNTVMEINRVWPTREPDDLRSEGESPFPAAPAKV
jgi:galactose-1-phosphate uridylyltransferase